MKDASNKPQHYQGSGEDGRVESEYIRGVN